MAGYVFNFDLMVPMMRARDMIPLTLMEEMEKNPDIMYFGADGFPIGSLGDDLIKKYPDRVIECGIAEADMVGSAAGAALSGKAVICQTFSCFTTMRATDQILLDVAYNEAPVCLICTHGGLTSGGGPTHNAVQDVSVVSAMPNMTVCVAADANQCVLALKDFLANPRPMFIRIPQGEEPLVYSTDDYGYQVGKAVTIADGPAATIIGTGCGTLYAKNAAELLAQEGIQVRVLDMHTIKPLDTEAVVKAAKETGGIITVEDHAASCGLGSYVANVLAENGLGIKFKKLGIPDEFAKLGYAAELHAYYGYDVDGIIRTVKEMI
ncbi:MAG: transketolase [Lachnospiraceae bacterium]|nr:transketolase [Lachnospiraceae bacterium]